uniref:SAP domain-containing protein n=1 Tax=Auxenochlorella protothecoides TaxID=3075 RepID=A0A1D2A9V0_AUXPR
MATGLALLLELPGLPISSIFRVHVPLAPGSSCMTDAEKDARARGALTAIKALSSTAVPFLARIADAWNLELVCSKARLEGEGELLPLPFIVDVPTGTSIAMPHPDNLLIPMQAHVGAIYKLLLAQQAGLGIAMSRDVRAHVQVGALAGAQAATVARWVAESALERAGWWRVAQEHLLSACLLEAATGERLGQCLRLGVEAVDCVSPTALRVFLRTDSVRYTRWHALPSDDPAALAALSERVTGSLCSVLPFCRPGIVSGIQPCSTELATRLQEEWRAGAGYALPLPGHTVGVRFEEDPDGDVAPYPPSCILSSSGLEAESMSPAALMALAGRLVGDLDGQPNPLLPAARMACGAVHTWRSSDASPVKGAGNSSPFTSGLGVGGLVPGSASRHLGLVLGPAVEAGAGQPGSHDEQGPCRHRRKTREQHSRAGEWLKQYLVRVTQQAAQEECEAAAARGAGYKVSARLLNAPTPQAPKRRGAVPKRKVESCVLALQQPKRPRLVQPRRAIPVGPSEAAGMAATTPGPTKESGGPGTGQDATPTEPSACNDAPGAAAVALETMPAAPPAGPKAIARPRARAADVDVGALMVKAAALHSAGQLSKLTVLELKAFLKARQAGLKGKKTELEARVQAMLVSGAAPAAAAEE